MPAKSVLLAAFVFLLAGAASPVQAAHETITVPVILADYYGFAYYQAFKDHAVAYAYPTAVVDLLGWGLVLDRKDAGMFCVNLTGLAKTVYPLAVLCGKPDREVKRRAWWSIGTHAASLLWLQAWGRPGLRVDTAYRFPEGGDVRLTMAF